MPNEWVSLEVRATCYKNRDTVDDEGQPRNICHHIDFNHNNNDPENLIFLSESEHNKVHANDRRGDYWDRVSKSMSIAKTGEKNAMYGKKHSAETKEKMSVTQLCHFVSDETKEKQSKVKKGRHWFNNGIRSVLTYECPPGFTRGRI